LSRRANGGQLTWNLRNRTVALIADSPDHRRVEQGRHKHRR
jgi:hypothetical protein